MRLRTVSPNDAGWTRRRAGRGFVYLDGAGRRLSSDDVQHQILVDSDDICSVVQELRRRRGGGDRLLVFRQGRRWSPVQASDVNAYLREIFGGEVTAKDFRTWHATVLAATSLADTAVGGATNADRKRAIRRAVVEVSEYLGNTPTIARGSSIDPRVIDLYQDGTTIASALQRAPEHPQRRQEHLEKAVLRMLSKAPASAQRSSRVRSVTR